MSKALVKADPVPLPVVIKQTCSVVGQLTKALGVPRSVLASDDEIEHVWADLPRLLARIPREQINVLHARMVVAVSTGWIDRFGATHEAQRNLLITTLHGIYCDPASSQETRLNAFDLCKHFADEFPAKLKADLLNQHSEYIAGGKEKRQEASRQFFTSLG